MSKVCRKECIALAPTLLGWLDCTGPCQKDPKKWNVSLSDYQYSFQGSKDLFKQILFQMCIYERKVALPETLILVWDWRNKPFQQAFPPGAPSRSSAWRAGGREGRGCRNETFVKGCVVASGRCNRCVPKMPSSAQLVFLLAVTRALEGKKAA